MLMTYLTTRLSPSPLGPVVDACRGTIRTLGLTSGIINLLTLTGSLFMMQVYDRVLGSQSIPTLLGLSMIAIVAYLFQGWLEALRARILTLVGEKIDKDVSDKVHAVGMKLAVASQAGAQEASQASRDLDTIRGFVTGQGLIAALDMPWTLLYVAVASLLHPVFGATALIAIVLLAWLTWKTERESKASSKEAFEAGARRSQIMEANLRGSEAMHGNGMVANRLRLWKQAHDAHLEAQRRATFIVGGYSSASKTVRMVLQSLVLGIGSYLAIKGQITSGSIIAASIVVARALSPIDQAIASWRPFTAARDANERLSKLLTTMPARIELMSLARPSRTFAVKDLAIVPTGSQTATLAGVTFNLKAGDVLGIVGASGSGKTTLVKALVGAWKPARGSISFDGSGPEQWSDEVLGRVLGYLPQDVQLFDGTIADNIARFDVSPDETSVQAAAISAGLDQYIRAAYPKTGYNTPVGTNGGLLPGGLRQRLGLARALYGEPFLVVLDEPNSNLDDEGNLALRGAIREARARKAIVIIVTHRPDVLHECDYLMVLSKGVIQQSGTREDVLPKWLARQALKDDDAVRAELAALDARRLNRANSAAMSTSPEHSSPTEVAPSGAVAPPQPHGESAPERNGRSWSTPPSRLTRSQVQRGL